MDKQDERDGICWMKDTRQLDGRPFVGILTLISSVGLLWL